MKKRRKFQNQQIILNQDTHIKFYSNFLTFCSLNSFRLKYYYYYLRFTSIFQFYNNFLLNSFLINFFLIRLVSSSIIHFSFFNFYESNLLQKFVDSKNILSDYLDYIKIKPSASVISRNSYLNKNFLESYWFYTSSKRDDSQSVSSLSYLRSSNIFIDADLFVLSSYNNHIRLLQNFIFFINFINYINMYKIFILLSLYKNT